MPFHEIISFPATYSFAADPARELQKAEELFATVDGCLGVFAGVAEEEQTGRIIILWKSYEHHKALTSRINYSEILGLKDSHKIYRLELNNDPLPALLAPITEVSTLILKPGKTKPELDAIVTADLPFTSEPGCFGPISWGATLEFSNTIFMLFGWESTKKHYETMGKPAQTGLVGKMVAVVDFEVVHVRFERVL